MPSDARPELLTFPVAMSCPAMLVTVSLGIAKPIPAAAPPSCGLVAASVGMPITCPARFTRAPPLLPGLMAALVWIALMITAELPWPSDTVRPVAETMPSVTVPVRPSGLPMASTTSPTRTWVDRPKDAGRSEPPPSRTLITARSSGANTPTTFAASALPPLARPTCSAVAVPTTCALVTMSPLVSYTTPDPDPELVVICTTDGSTRATTCSYCCSKEEASPEETAAGDRLAAAPPGPLPPAPLQAAAVKTTSVIPAPAKHRLAAGLRGLACAARLPFLSPDMWLPITLMRIPGLLYAHAITAPRCIRRAEIPLGP